MSIFRRTMGVIVILTALLGVILSVGCAAYSGQLIDDVATQALDVIGLTQDNLGTTTAALKLAQETIYTVNDTLDTVAETAVNLSTAVSETNPLFNEISDITTTRIPDSLAAVEETLPNIAEVAGTVDDTLTILSTFGFRRNFFGLGEIDFDLGIDYNPKVRFDDSIITLAESMDGLPEQLRTLEPQLDLAQTNLELITGNVDRLSSDIESINQNLAELPDLLGEYITTLDTLDGQLVTAKTEIKQRLDSFKIGALLLALWFGLLQIAPLYMGWEMVTSLTDQQQIKVISENLEERIEDIVQQQDNEPTET